MAAGEQFQVRVTVEPFLYAPVEQGQPVGTLRLYCDGQLLAERILNAGAYIPARERKGFLQKLLSPG